MVTQAIYDRLPTEMKAVAHTFKTQNAPLWAANRKEAVARFHDIYHLMSSGDWAWYSGRKPHSWLIRIATISNMSHGATVEVTGPNPEDVYLLETVEATGVRKIGFLESIERDHRQGFWHGQWYWSGINYDAFPGFDGQAAVEYIHKLLRDKTRYGKKALLWEACFHLPIIREIAYWRYHKDLGAHWDGAPPYCSALQILSGIAGGLTTADKVRIEGWVSPVPGRSPHLSAPADTFHSLLCNPEKIALVP